MKSNINQFDYPNKEIQNFKNFSRNQLSETNDKTTYNKTRYKQNMQYQMEQERNKVKELQKYKKDLEAKKNKAKMEQELQKKKQELENLQHLKKQAEQNQRQSYEMAMLKQEQDKIKKQEDQRKRKQFDENATNRFGQALKRLHLEKQENSFKEKLAEQRRNVADKFEKMERINANKYKSTLQLRQKRLQSEEALSAEEYKKRLANSGLNKSTDYNKTCLHNLKIVPQKNKEQENAFQRGMIVREVIQQKSEQKRKAYAHNLRKSQQRGKQALQRMQREREYEQFQKQTEEQQKQYNLLRIQAGKRNQFIGLKPTTLSQMEINKKQRSEEEFDKMFFTRPFNKTQSFNREATKFEIVQTRMPSNKQNSAQSLKQTKSQTKLSNRLQKAFNVKEREESQIPCVSEGKYSFEEPEYSEFKNQSRSHSNIKEVEEEHHQNQQETSHQNGYNVKNAWRQTGIPNEKYTSSPEHEAKLNKQSNRRLKQQNYQIKNQKITKKEEGSERQSFNTDQMLRKYGLKRDSPQKKVQKSLKGIVQGESKRKVVELANICQNKEHQKQELNYSSQSEEDSNM